MFVTTIGLDEETLTALKHLAVDERRTVRGLIREAVAQYLKRAGR